MLPSHDAPVQEWLNAGLAVLSAKGERADLGGMSFAEAEAKALVYLTGEGAQKVDQEARRQAARP
jgi:hypothetical protein